jgi:hypothetical protein
MKDRLSLGVSALVIAGSSLLLWAMLAGFAVFVVTPAIPRVENWVRIAVATTAAVADDRRSAAGEEPQNAMPAAPLAEHPLAVAALPPAPKANGRGGEAAAGSTTAPVEHAAETAAAPRRRLPRHPNAPRARQRPAVAVYTPFAAAYSGAEFVPAGSGWSGGTFGPAPYAAAGY